MVEKTIDENEKKRIAALKSLPDWFGIEESMRRYIDESAQMPFWADFDNGEPIGFIALKETSPYTAEIDVMGVLPQSHRRGAGMRLWQAFRQYAVEHGYEYAQVKTVQKGRYAEYDATNAFYEHIGFRALECLPTLWDEQNPCQIYVQRL